jgi:hypothetical protein
VARNLLHLRTGQPAQAYAAVRAVGDAAEARGYRHPVIVPWRSRAALVITPKTVEHQLAATYRKLDITPDARCPSGFAKVRRTRRPPTPPKSRTTEPTATICRAEVQLPASASGAPKDATSGAPRSRSGG